MSDFESNLKELESKINQGVDDKTITPLIRLMIRIFKDEARCPLTDLQKKFLMILEGLDNDPYKYYAEGILDYENKVRGSIPYVSNSEITSQHLSKNTPAIGGKPEEFSFQPEAKPYIQEKNPDPDMTLF